MQTPQQIWKSCCEASVEIQARHGHKAAVDYIVGEKLMMFAQTGESHPELLAELPAFSMKIRSLFTDAQIQEHFERAALASRVDPEIFKGATAEEAEELREAFEEDRSNQERRGWVKAMLLREGS